MAFDKAMRMMKGPSPKKPKKAPDEEPGREKSEPKGEVGGEESEGSPIHEHLQKMHEMTGNAHSHIEHHMDGHHTSHHISEMGEMSGPHEHPDMGALHAHMSSMMGGGEPKAEMAGGHPFNSEQNMSGF